ncbi:MAG: HD domain-containing protein [Deltaproteobacteria bacterium]|nr:HD domain-containing protein [Deltaproteobacteria bacterium]
MEAQVRGRLILNSIPTSDIGKKTTVFLSQYYKNTPTEKLEEALQQVPLTLGKEITHQFAHKIISGLEQFGASAIFIPKDDAGIDDSHDSEKEKRDATISEETHKTAQPFYNYTTVHKPVKDWKSILWYKLEEVNKELWLIFSMFVIVGIMNYLVASQGLLLGLYTLPTILSAYHYGRRHATLTALMSIMLVGFFAYFNPNILNTSNELIYSGTNWHEFLAWGSILIITAYAMGTLYERNKKRMEELRKTYKGIIIILRNFISNDKYTENHCYRVSIYVSKIARYLGMDPDQIDDLRSAALLHDLGKLEISRELLYKASMLSDEEYSGIKKHVNKGVEMMDPLSGSLGRIIPIILAHHEKFDGSGYFKTEGKNIPLEARILSLADVYDALVSDRPYRKAMSPFEAKEIIVNGSGTDFDPVIVEAFIKAFNRGEMDVPNVII